MRWLLWRSEKSSLMCHDAIIVFWDLKNVHTSVMRHWLLLRFENVHKCAMVHWLFLRNATWSHMCHDALMFLRCVECSHVSRCTGSFWDLKIVHTCVMLKWLGWWGRRKLGGEESESRTMWRMWGRALQKQRHSLEVPKFPTEAPNSWRGPGNKVRRKEDAEDEGDRRRGARGE